MHDESLEHLRRHLFRPRIFCNTGLADRLACDELFKSQLISVPADKAGMFVLCNIDNIIDAHSDIFRKQW